MKQEAAARESLAERAARELQERSVVSESLAERAAREHIEKLKRLADETDTTTDLLRTLDLQIRVQDKRILDETMTRVRQQNADALAQALRLAASTLPQQPAPLLKKRPRKRRIGLASEKPDRHHLDTQIWSEVDKLPASEKHKRGWQRKLATKIAETPEFHQLRESICENCKCDADDEAKVIEAIYKALRAAFKRRKTQKKRGH